MIIAQNTPIKGKLYTYIHPNVNEIKMNFETYKLKRLVSENLHKNGSAWRHITFKSF